MHLFGAHEVLIAIAILFCAGVAVRDVASGNGYAAPVLRGAAWALAASGLALYLRWFARTKASGLGAMTLRSNSALRSNGALRSSRVLRSKRPLRSKSGGDNEL